MRKGPGLTRKHLQALASDSSCPFQTHRFHHGLFQERGAFSCNKGGLEIEQLVFEAWQSCRRSFSKAERTSSHKVRALGQLAMCKSIEGNVEFTSQALARLSWTFATSRVGNVDLIDQLASLVSACALRNELGPRDVASSAWAFARLTVLVEVGRLPFESARNLNFSLAGASARVMSELEPRGIASIAWSYATSRVFHQETLLSLLAIEACRKIHNFLPQDCANVAWSFAKLTSPSAQLFNNLASRFPQVANEFSTQGLANFIWAFSALAIDDRPFLTALSQAALSRKTQEFSTQDIANTFWSFAIADWSSQLLLCELSLKCLSALAAEFPSRSSEFSPQGLANLAWSLASISSSDATLLFDIVLFATPRRCSEFSLQAASNIAWAFATIS
eukprot:TRINITY_DN4284_c3_g1_i4.p1 TRINITY_DN4284_c3_g1~~TRINITY_DN4284_c3_g1_i4.p1  ORF type:complete len:391 (-),score=41.36 TRINITY_DN4284_c3_g1_i4:31-1203(-)